ncbi:MAG: mandelate racemase/muconate lactonizing enzyme family protein [Gaiellales bacterium]
MTSIVRGIDAIAVRVPLREQTSFSTRAVLHRDYVLVTITDADGAQGIGYTYAGTTSGPWVREAVRSLIAPLLVGRDADDVKRNWELVYRTFLLEGRRGAFIRALSAVDIAAWDLRGVRAGMPLRRLLGGTVDEVAAYASGGYYRDGDPLENVTREVERYRQLGFVDYKMKVGRDPSLDVARIAAAREALGPAGRIALDANNAWNSVEESLTVIRRYAEHDIWWVEEPLLPDDVRGHAELVRRSPITIATGEIEATRWGFAPIFREGAAEIIQPDAGVAGGITEWLTIAATAESFGVPVAPHWHANLHAQLSAATPGCITVEYFALDEDIYNFEALVADPLAIRDGRIVLPNTPGNGVALDPDAVARFTLD